MQTQNGFVCGTQCIPCELISRLADDFLAARVILILILGPWGMIFHHHIIPDQTFPRIEMLSYTEDNP